MRQHLGQYLVDHNFPGLPIVEAGELEMKAVANPVGFTPAENRSIRKGMERFIATHTMVDEDLDRFGAQSLAGPSFLNRHAATR